MDLASLSFEVQELPDIIRLVILLSLKREDNLTKSQLKNKVEGYLENNTSIEMSDLEETLEEMQSEKLVKRHNNKLVLTSQGAKLSEEWKDLLVKREPILEFIAGLTDGTITSLVIVISTFLAKLPTDVMLLVALLTLTAVAVTNFSSFMLGGETEDIANALSFKTLMEYSVSDIPDKEERRKSLRLIRHLFSILKGEKTRTNIISASISGVTTFLAGIIPIAAFLSLSEPFNMFISFIMVGVVLFFLVRYRSEKSKIHWKITLFETLLVVAIAVVLSLLLGRL